MTTTALTRAQRRGYRVSLARTRAPGLVLAAALVLGFLSDVLDGIVGRRAGAVTPFLRRLDSSVDTVFYLGVAYAAWHRRPDELRALAVPIVIVIVGAALLPVALAAGVLAQAETLAITLVLRGWRHDVPSVWNAIRIPA